jgi:diguanylate cyclase (GGDEF)-like protein
MERKPSASRILLVDDDPASADEFRLALAPLAHEVDVVTSAGKALGRAHREHYQVVVIDMTLRGIDGFAVVEAIHGLSPLTMFVIATSESRGRLPMRSRGRPWVSSLLMKPWNTDEVVAKIGCAQRLYERRAASRSGVAASALSVLVIEDSPTDALLVRHHVSSVEGASVVVVPSLSAATVALHDTSFDVIVTDLSLPDAQGVDAVLRLRSAGPGAAIVVSSGIDDDALVLQLLQIGAHEFLAKSELTSDRVRRALTQAVERKRFEVRLARLAYYDALTGAANRAGLSERGAEALERAARRNERVAVFLLDLDGFKAINDQLGHDAGDALLQGVVARLHGLLRAYDIVARFGGDEFAMLVTDVGPDLAVEELAARILASLRVPFAIAGHESMEIRGSLGVAIFPSHGEQLSALLKAADAAMYEAKRQGKDRAVVGRRPTPSTDL